MRISRIGFALCLLAAQSGAQSHPALFNQAQIAKLAAGGTEWDALQTFCDANLDKLIGSGYAGWDWHDAAVQYAKAYQVAKTKDPAQARKYGLKALALMKVLARHHYFGGVANGQTLGLGDGTRKSFALPFAPADPASVAVFTVPVERIPIVYQGAAKLPRFEPILKISDTPQGAADYAPGDYTFLYRSADSTFVLHWGAKHPASGGTYYVSLAVAAADKEAAYKLAAGQFTVSGTTLALSAPPAETLAVCVRYLGADYEQTGNLMGGRNSVQPDGPGYPMRTFNPGLAFGFDALYDFADFTPALKAEFVGVLNDQLDWYLKDGYEHNGDLGNYFIRGLLTSEMFTGYGTAGANPRADEFKTAAAASAQHVADKLQAKLPGGYGPQGQYANGVANDIVETLSIYKDLTGTDLLSKLDWTANFIPAVIHGTKPDGVSFYDGGDWDPLPATPLIGGLQGFLAYLPDHPMAPYARQLIKNAGGKPVPPGPLKDYKADFPLDYFAKVSGPFYARSDWGAQAVWVSLAAGEIFLDHQHRDQGHITLQRGSDNLLIDAGGYGDFATTFHNTLLFDDRGAGDISTYPPGQGVWSGPDIGIRRTESAPGYAYAMADFARAYVSPDGSRNSVKAAVREMLFLRPEIVIVHDRARTANAAVKQIFNCNFPGLPSRTGDVFSVAKGSSRLFMKSLIPSAPSPVIAATAGNPAIYNYQVSFSGQADHTFLHVFQATSKDSAAMAPSAYLDAGDAEGAEVRQGDTNWAAVFPKLDSLAGTVHYAFSQAGPQRHLIVGLQPDQIYSVTATIAGRKSPDSKAIAVSANGVLSFTFPAAQAGEVTLVNTGKVGIADAPRTDARMRFRSERGALRVEVSLDRPARVGLDLFDCDGVKLESAGERRMAPGDHVLFLASETRIAGGAARVRFLRASLHGEGWSRSFTYAVFPAPLP